MEIRETPMGGNLDNSDIFPRVRKILARMLKIKEEKIKPESLLRHGLGVDSLDISETVSKVEEGHEAGIILSPSLDFTIGDMIICHG
jgi:acyl carrier protein